MCIRDSHGDGHISRCVVSAIADAEERDEQDGVQIDGQAVLAHDGQGERIALCLLYTSVAIPMDTSVTARIAPSQPVTFRRSESPRTRCSAIFSPPRCFVRFAFSLV